MRESGADAWLGAMLALLLAGCAGAPTPCGRDADCGSGVCHLSACGGPGERALAGTRRVVLTPRAVRVAADIEPGPEVEIGGDGTTDLYLDVADLPAKGVVRAFVLLEPVEGLPLAEIAFWGAAIRRPFEATATPVLDERSPLGTHAVLAPGVVRLDVTDLVRGPAREGRLAIVASSAATRSRITTAAVRVELYVER